MIHHLTIWLQASDAVALLSQSKSDLVRVCLDRYLGDRIIPLIPKLLRSRLEDVPIKAIRLGSEDCLRHVPSNFDIEAILNLCRNQGIRLEMALPVISEAMLSVVERIATIAKSQPDMLLVVNDIGTLRLARAHGVSYLALGRLMWKQKRMARFSSEEIQNLFDKNALEEYRTLEMPAWSRDFGIREYEADLAPQGIEMHADECHWTFHIPWCIVAFGRTCVAAGIHQNASEKFKIDRPCQTECDNIAEVFENPHWPKPLIRHGKLVLAAAGMDDCYWFDMKCAHKIVIDGTRSPLRNLAAIS